MCDLPGSNGKYLVRLRVLPLAQLRRLGRVTAM